MSTPLNQTYRMSKTFAENAAVSERFMLLSELSAASGQNVVGGGIAYPWGRRYDYAVLKELIGSTEGSIVADLGARDGFFGSWLTEEADRVYVSDYFEEWGKGTPDDLGQLDVWTSRWKAMAAKPERLHCESQDITCLAYADGFFDIVLCTSVVEHIRNKDVAAMSEIVRVCKSGGLIAMSTDMSELNDWHSGTFWYNQKSLFDRLIVPHPVSLVGDYDFAIDHQDNDACDFIFVEGRRWKTSPVVFCLRKD